MKGNQHHVAAKLAEQEEDAEAGNFNVVLKYFKGFFPFK
jgi:hypothetical protein